MLTSSGQGRQLVHGFANQVQRQKAICDKRMDFRKPGLKTGVKKDIYRIYSNKRPTSN